MNITQIQVNGDSYNICDAITRESFSTLQNRSDWKLYNLESTPRGEASSAVTLAASTSNAYQNVTKMHRRIFATHNMNNNVALVFFTIWLIGNTYNSSTYSAHPYYGLWTIEWLVARNSSNDAVAPANNKGGDWFEGDYFTSATRAVWYVSDMRTIYNTYYDYNIYFGAISEANRTNAQMYLATYILCKDTASMGTISGTTLKTATINFS